jgi:hypothetical protein
MPPHAMYPSPASSQGSITTITANVQVQAPQPPHMPRPMYPPVQTHSQLLGPAATKEVRVASSSLIMFKRGLWDTVAQCNLLV